VASGSAVTFRVEAHRPTNADGDNFRFDYSTDDLNYTALLTVASDVEEIYAASLPAATSGTVFIRVQDTVRSWGTNSLDALYVDRLVIETAGAQPLPPVAFFSGDPTSGFVPLTVDFTDESSNLPTGWSWDFGDGNGSTEQNPSHTYWAAETYTVILTATNQYGSDTHTEIDYITVSEPTGGTMHVHDIVVGRRITGPNHSGVADITIYDDTEQPAANATVYATASGPVGGDFSGSTGVDGTVHFETGKVRNPMGEWCFEVTDVTHETLAYNAAANHVTMSCESGDMYRATGGPEAALLFDLRADPNPSRAETWIRFRLPEVALTRLTVLDLQGRVVAVPVKGTLPAGEHAVRFKDGDLPVGVYFYRLDAGSRSGSGRLVRIH
jgi:PKD repeat protein